MICPICKNEYRDGFTHCPDCDVDLVDSLDEVLVPVMFGQEDELGELAGILEENGIAQTDVRFDEKDQIFELFIPKGQIETAKEILQAVMAEEDAEADSDEDIEVDESDYDGDEIADIDTYGDEQAVTEGDDAETVEVEVSDGGDITIIGSGDERDEDIRVSTVYESKRDKAENHKSSAGALILVGGLGMVAIALLNLDMLPIRLYGGSKYLISGVMAVLFVIFIGMGVTGLKNYKRYLAEAEEEEDLISRAGEFLASTLTKEAIEEAAAGHMEGGKVAMDQAAKNELLYFPRMEVIRGGLKEAFPEMETALLEKMADDHYTELFGA
ncbi:MAG: hypothetical protein IK078_06630 [Lachnospiraceae bacterium]|nr:hypothetical protein [Lachnospiraceae bacterium]